MSLTIPIFPLIVGSATIGSALGSAAVYIMNAYIQTHHRFAPSRMIGITLLSPEQAGPNGHLRNWRRDGRTISIQTGTAIREGLQPFLDSIGIRQDLSIIDTSIFSITGLGTNFFTGGEALITCNTDIHRLDEHASIFMIKHEVALIKNNDLIILPAVQIITNIALALLAIGVLIVSASPAISLFSTCVVVIGNALFSRYRAAKADDFAIEHSSNEELRGGLRFLNALQRYHLSHRATDFGGWITYSPTGEKRFDIKHPSLENRIEKITGELRRRNITINTSADEHLISGIATIFLRPQASTAPSTAQAV